MFKIYEVWMFVLNGTDNRVVTASLELLQVLFKFLPFKFNIFLTSIGSIDDSFILKKQHIFSSQRRQSLDAPDEHLKPMLNLQETTKKPVETLEPSIGQFYSKLYAPIDYIVRFLACKYLLNIDSSKEHSHDKLKPDAQVKVLLKTIAFEVCTSAVALCPHLMFYAVIIPGDDFVMNVRSRRVESNQMLYLEDEDESSYENSSNDENDEPLSKEHDKNTTLFIYDLINYLI